MFRLRLAWIAKKTGKTPTGPAAEWGAEYARRIGRYATLNLEPLSPAAAPAALRRHAAASRLWLFDPAGRPFTSPQFAALLQREAAVSGKELVFALGGPEGFPPGCDAPAAGAISLSSLTLSHELARVLALEQLYRALTLLAGHPYAK